MTDLPMRWDQIATILFFGGLSWWAVKWAGRNLRAQIGESRPAGERSALSREAVDAIVARGLASRELLFQMSPAEQQLLAQAALALGTVRGTANGPLADSAEIAAPSAHCPRCGTFVENWPREVPWRCDCAHCSAQLVLRRDGTRLVLSYTPPA